MPSCSQDRVLLEELTATALLKDDHEHSERDHRTGGGCAACHVVFGSSHSNSDEITS